MGLIDALFVLVAVFDVAAMSWILCAYLDRLVGKWAGE